MMSSVITLRLNRRRAFSNDSPLAVEFLPNASPPTQHYIDHIRAYSLCAALRGRQLPNHAIYFAKPLNILQLVFIQPEIVTQFMDDRKADLFADFGLAGADRFDILLIEHDVIGS